MLGYFKLVIYFNIKQNEQAVYLVFSRDVFRALSSISDEAFVKTVNDFQSLTIFAKSSILNYWQGSVRKDVLRNFAKIHGKTSVPESLF